jgi:hypothetical protein
VTFEELIKMMVDYDLDLEKRHVSMNDQERLNASTKVQVLEPHAS